MLLVLDKPISIKTFVKYLTIVFLVLLALHGVSSYSVHCCGGIIKRLDFNHESNFPTLYASLLLLFAGLLLKRISVLGTANTKNIKLYWKSLSYIFIFLAIDELFRVHDHLNQGVYGQWLKLYIPLVLIIGLMYLNFLFKLPKRFRNLIFISGTVFVTGALGFEIIGLFFKKAGYQTLDPAYRVLVTVEESLEFIGVIMFIYTLLHFIYSETNKAVVLKFPFEKHFKK